MKKIKIPKLKLSTKLFMTGAIIVFTAPFLKEILGFFLTQNCPIVWGKIECGLDQGFQNTSFMMGFLALWFGIGIIVLAAGIVEHFSTKRSRL